MLWKLFERRLKTRSSRIACDEGEATALEPLRSISANVSLASSFLKGHVVAPSPVWSRLIGRSHDSGGLVILPEVIARTCGGREPLAQIIEEACRRRSVVITRAAGPYEDEVDFRSSTSREAVEAFADEMFSFFQKLYKGFSPNEGQALAFRALPELAERGGTMVVIMPTGSGKSAIYQVASRVLASAGVGSYALVISPLRALMRDQVIKSRALGLRAEMIDSSVPTERREEIIKDVELGLTDLLYISPERIQDEMVRALIERSPPSLYVLDEAHAVIEWGYSFRPAYAYAVKTIRALRENHRPPVLALSATMSRAATHELLSLLGEDQEDRDRPRPVIIKLNRIREDIDFEIVPAPQGYERLEILEKVVKRKIEESRRLGNPWRGVIFTSYAFSTSARWANVSTIVGYLSKRLDVEVAAYHGGMRDKERERIEKMLMSGPDELIVVSTKALGMGVDVPNVRWVTHYLLSDSVEDFYQEIGRAGRDGKGASSVVLYNSMDANLKILLSELPRPSFIMRVLNTLASLSSISDGQIIFPDTLFGAPRKTVIALEILRSVGMIDYHIMTRGRPTIGEGTYTMKVNGVSISVPGRGGVDYYSCHNPLFLSVSIVHDGKEIVRSGRCAGRWTPVKWGGRSIIVEPLSEMRIFLKPPPSLFTLYLRELSLEEARVEKLRALLELAMVGGKERILEGLFKHLEDGKAFNGKDISELALGETECSDCIERAVQLYREAELSLGNRGVSLYYDTRESLESFYSAYRKATGVPLASRSGSVDKLLREVGRRGPEAIFDRGLIVLISRRRGSTLRVIEYLKDHGYFSAFLW